jgi:hypothetical protein
MRADIQLTLAFRFFKGPLISFFILFMFVTVCIFSVLLVIDSYDLQLQKRFASKQPHFTLTLNQSVDDWTQFKQTKSLLTLKKTLLKQNNVLAVSEFIKVTKWLRLKAATSQISGFESSNEFDKFSTGRVTLVGIERQLPSVIPLTHLNYYDSGPYKFKITNLEYGADWLLNPKLILPNATLDASFYTPITQQVSVKQDGADETSQIKAFVTDYSDESILYLGLDQMENWLDSQDIKETGLYIRIQENHSLEETKKDIVTVLKQTDQNWQITTWLDDKSKQKTILLMTKLLGYSFIVLLLIMLSLVLLLNQSNVLITKARSLKILYMTGYLLTAPLVVTSLIASILGVIVAYFIVSLWLAPFILNAFSLSAQIQNMTAWGVSLFTLMIINLINLMGMKSRLGY